MKKNSIELQQIIDDFRSGENATAYQKVISKHIKQALNREDISTSGIEMLCHIYAQVIVNHQSLSGPIKLFITLLFVIVGLLGYIAYKI